MLQTTFLVSWSYSVYISFAGKSFIWPVYYSNKISGWGKWRGKVYNGTLGQVYGIRILFLKTGMGL